MGFLDCASGNSIWRGYDYYVDQKVIAYSHEEKSIYTGVVAGSGDNKYKVRIDVNHPRKTICNCPFAEGRPVVCKHAVALFFTIFPGAAEDLLREAEEYEAQEELRYEEHLAELKKYVMSLKKKELQTQLYWALLELEDRR